MPEIPLSFSPQQYALVRHPLMRQLVAVQRYEAGNSPDPYLPITFEPDPPNRRFDPQLALAVKSAWKKLYCPLGTFRRRRVRLTLPELMMVKLAASRSLRFISTNLSAGTVKRPERVRRLLMKSLQRARKRLRRKIEAELGKSAYQAIMNRWRPFNAWLRHFPMMPHSRLPPDGTILRFHKRILNAAVDVAKRALLARGIFFSNEAELRRLVRRAVAAVRRGRTDFGIRTLINSSAGATYLADFITVRALSAQKAENND